MQAMIQSVFTRLQSLSLAEAGYPPEQVTSPLSPAAGPSTMPAASSEAVPVTPRLEDPPLKMSAPDPTSGSIPAASTTMTSTNFKRSSSYGFLGAAGVPALPKTPERSAPASPIAEQREGRHTSPVRSQPYSNAKRSTSQSSRTTTAALRMPRRGRTAFLPSEKFCESWFPC